MRYKINALMRTLTLLAALIVGLMIAPATAEQPSHGFLPVKAAKSQVVPAQQFDGKALYKAAFEVLRDYHLSLADDATRKTWVAEWENKHANDGALSTEDGTDKAIREMVESLGHRYDSYLDDEQTKDRQEAIDATLVGVGISIKLKDQEELVKSLPKNVTPDQVKETLKVSDKHPLMVEEPFEGGPAEKAGVQTGDRITKVDGKSIDGLRLDEVVSKIRGKEKTEVTITVERTDAQGKVAEHTFKVTRARVVVKVVKFKDLGNGVSYIKLKDFVSQFAVQEMSDALTKASKGRAVIIDLRGNGGGSLSTVLTMSAMILPEGTILVTHDRDGGAIRHRRVTVQHDYLIREQPDAQDPSKVNLNIEERQDLVIPANMPVIVLVDGGSASASEILSGVLQHHHRALIVGTPTLGKGVGQSVINLPFGRRINVTSFEFLPGGAAMDWIGIVPDVQIEQPKGVKDDKQLEAALKAAGEALHKQDALDKQKQDLKKKNEDEFKKSRDSK